MAFGYYSPIPVDYTKVPNTDQTDFPVLVSLTDARFKTVGNGGKVQNANGYDIYFYSDSGLTTRLPAERETYNATTGAIVFWVKRTLSHEANTNIFIAYGDSGISTDPNTDGTYGATSTWNSNFKGVWHFPNGSSLTVLDSTGVNNGANTGVVAAAGKIDGGAHFDTNSDIINVGADASLNIYGSNLTISAWIYMESFGHDDNGRGRIFVGDYTMFFVDNVNVSKGLSLIVDGSSALVSTASIIDINAWYHVAVAFTNGSTPQFYVNAVAKGTPANSNSLVNSLTTHYIGNRSDSDRGFDGILDEVRVSNTLRSADWVVTEFNNQNSPSTFCVLGTELEVDAGGVSVTPSPATGKGATASPAVILGALNISPGARSAAAASLDPTVVLGALSIEPAASAVKAAKTDPAVILASLILGPNASIAKVASVDPLAVLGTISLAPAAVAAQASSTGPTVVFGSLSVSPTAVFAVATGVDPTVNTGVGVSLTPAALSARASTTDPALVLGSISLEPPATLAACLTSGPTVLAGAIAKIIRAAISGRGPSATITGRGPGTRIGKL